MRNLQALYFGHYFQSCFALLFTPAIRKYPHAVLICKPIGQENIRTNKAVIQLGREISNQGVVAMAFDYYGTGDSPGELQDMTLNTCLDGIHDAATYLKSQFNVDDIIVLGIRAGALFMYEVNNIINPRATILWHPVMNGLQYLKEMQSRHKSWLMGSFVSKNGKFHKQTEVLGFLYSERFTNEISNIEIDLNKLSRDKECLLIDDASRLKEKLEMNKNIKLFPSKHNNFWTKNGLDEPIVPVHDIKSISKWIRDIDMNGIKIKE